MCNVRCIGAFPTRLVKAAIALVALLGVICAFSQEISLTEYQVKALCLVNFAKYIQWPSAAFADAKSPVAIGVAGESKFGSELENAVRGKMIGGRAVVIQQIRSKEDLSKCQVVFISASERNRLGALLDKVKTKPVLTVGDTAQFARRGVVMNFVKRDGKVRFEVDLGAARLAGLHISSKVLNLADAVYGKE